MIESKKTLPSTFCNQQSKLQCSPGPTMSFLSAIKHNIAAGPFEDPHFEEGFLRHFRAGGLQSIIWGFGLVGACSSVFAIEHLWKFGVEFRELDPMNLALVSRIGIATTCAAFLYFSVLHPKVILRHFVPTLIAFALVLLLPVALLSPIFEPAAQAPIRPIAGFALSVVCLFAFARLPIVSGLLITVCSALLLFVSISNAGVWNGSSLTLVAYPVIAILAGWRIAKSIETRERALYLLATRAQNKSDEKTRLIGALAHDLRSPLAAIGHEVIVLGDQVERMPRTEVSQRLATVVGSIWGTREYLEYLLDWSQSACPSKAVQYEPVSIISLVARLEAEFYERACGVGVSLSFEISEVAKSVTLRSNPIELYSVLQNLVDNSIKYRDVKKDAAYTVVEIKLRDHECTIAVTDNGIGICATDLERIWDFGFRAKNSEGSARGAGIGLGIVKARVERMTGHSIHVTSALGVGTIFRVSIPQYKAIDDYTNESDERSADVGNATTAERVEGRALVVSDTENRIEEILDLTRKAIAFAECAVGMEQIQELLDRSDGCYDIVILNSKGNQRNDARLLAWIRKEHGFAVPAVVLRPGYMQLHDWIFANAIENSIWLPRSVPLERFAVEVRERVRTAFRSSKSYWKLKDSLRITSTGCNGKSGTDMEEDSVEVT